MLLNKCLIVSGEKHKLRIEPRDPSRTGSFDTHQTTVFVASEFIDSIDFIDFIDGGIHHHFLHSGDVPLGTFVGSEKTIFTQFKFKKI